jgi:hypothetical protein
VTPRWGAAAVGLALVLLLAPAAGAEVRQMEAVGALPLAPDARHASPPRDVAVRLALNEAVRRVALDLVPDLESGAAAEFLPEVLGDEPFDYTTRFRILEDRGERPALFSDDPAVEFEYVVVVEAHIDADRVEKRLVDAGLLAVSRAGAPTRDLRLVVEKLGSFAAYAALRAALIEGVGVKSALPVELERRRAVLLVRTPDDAPQLLEELLLAAPPELLITPLDASEDVLTLRVELEALPEGADSRAPPGGAGGAARRD